MPVTLTRRGWGFVLGAVAFGAAGFFIELRDFWHLPVFLVAVPIVAVLGVLLLRSTAGLEVRLLAADPTPSAGSAVALAAVVSHRLPFALSARVNWELGEAAATTDVHLPRGGSQRITEQWNAVRRGPAVVGIPTVLINDPLGVATVRVRCDTGASLENALVLPQLVDVAPESQAAVSHGDSAAHFASQSELVAEAPGGALRKYLPGDVKRMVDWKQSARQHELLVRVAEAADVSVRHITIDTTPGSYRSADEFEVAISEAATRGVAWLRGGHVVLVTVGGDPLLEFASEDELLRRLAHVTIGPGAYATE